MRKYTTAFGMMPSVLIEQTALIGHCIENDVTKVYLSRFGFSYTWPDGSGMTQFTDSETIEDTRKNLEEYAAKHGFDVFDYSDIIPVDETAIMKNTVSYSREYKENTIKMYHRARYMICENEWYHPYSAELKIAYIDEIFASEYADDFDCAALAGTDNGIYLRVPHIGKRNELIMPRCSCDADFDEYDVKFTGHMSEIELWHQKCLDVFHKYIKYQEIEKEQEACVTTNINEFADKYITEEDALKYFILDHLSDQLSSKSLCSSSYTILQHKLDSIKFWYDLYHGNSYPQYEQYRHVAKSELNRYIKYTAETMIVYKDDWMSHIPEQYRDDVLLIADAAKEMAEHARKQLDNVNEEYDEDE